jgi:signal transduction histidine kinase
MSESPASHTGRLGLTCPQCGERLPPDTRSCPHCGVDLVLLSLLAERAYLEGFPETAPIRRTPEALVPRIGEYLIDQGVLDEGKLAQALARQKEHAAVGKPRLLGQTLIDMGLVDRESLDRAITHQIIELHAALQESNRMLERRVGERTAELRRALERLTELNQIKANLISNISHELRTPLAHIKGYVELVHDEQLGPLSEEQKGAIDVIFRATERLERLIEDLIEYSTASRQGMTVVMEIVQLPGLAEAVLTRLRGKAAKADVELAVSVPADVPQVRADREKIGWVLYQLIDNGIKFTPAGGTVRLAAIPEGDQIMLQVQDSGIGIPQDRMQEIFEPFHQLDGSPTRRYGGTGLGLSLVKMILDAHGAKLAVSSADGEGSTFSFYLPVAEGSA